MFAYRVVRGGLEAQGSGALLRLASVASVVSALSVVSAALLAACGGPGGKIGTGEVGSGGGSEAPELQPTLASVQALVFSPGCAMDACHSQKTAAGALDLSSQAASHAGLVDVRATNPVAAENRWLRVKPGDPALSFLMRKLEAAGVGEGGPMPSVASALAGTYIDLLNRWIAEGASLGDPNEPARLPAGLPPLLIARERTKPEFSDPASCEECHPKHYQEWSISNHAYAIKDPVFLAMNALGQKQTEGRLGQFCVQCHTPTGLATGQTPVVRDASSGDFVQRLDALDPVAASGVSCDVCHSITEVIDPVNARVVYTPDGTKRSTIFDPVETSAHPSMGSALHGESRLCGSCHAVTNGKGAKIEETFPEWAESSFARDGVTCQRCHMPEYEGEAAPDGPQRTLHRHTFVGVDVSLLPPDEFPGYDELRSLTEALLKESVSMTVSAPRGQKRLEVRLENLAGHALPSGATAERRLWVEVILEDSLGRVVFETGTLDENGDLRDGVPGRSISPDSDPQLIVFKQDMFDVAPDGSSRIVDFPWQASSVVNTLIAADETVVRSIDLGALPAGEYRARVRLLFQSFPQYFLRKLEALAGLDPDVKTRVPTVEIDRRSLVLSL